MSLNDAERRRTSDELRGNLESSGLTSLQAAADLGFSPERLQATLRVERASDPVDVWLLRDYLEQAARDAGQSSTAYTVLTERSRRAARGWLHLHEAPRHVFAPS